MLTVLAAQADRTQEETGPPSAVGWSRCEGRPTSSSAEEGRPESPP